MSSPSGPEAIAIVRGLALILPLVATVTAAGLTRSPRRAIAAAIVATAWNLTVLVPLNLAAVELGWWSFAADGGTVAGLPVDLLLGWALLWGAVPALVVSERALPAAGVALVAVDMAVMPALDPVVRLGPAWLAGEALAVVLALVPGLVLCHWTRRGLHPGLRAWGQAIISGALFVALPVALVVDEVPSPGVLALTAQVVAVPMLLGLAAAWEFAARGRGTPLPYDPPDRLVTSGPYAFVRNPMQLAMAATLLGLAACLREPTLTAGAVVVVAYSVVVGTWHEGPDLDARFGVPWRQYRRAVPSWFPRWRAWPGAGAATVFVARDDCDACSSTGGWLGRSSGATLVVSSASHRPGARRIRYEADDGWAADGVAAVSAALQHGHLGWAVVGWLLGLPVVRHWAQLVVDALVGVPNPATVRRSDLTATVRHAKFTRSSPSAGPVG